MIVTALGMNKITAVKSGSILSRKFMPLRHMKFTT